RTAGNCSWSGWTRCGSGGTGPWRSTGSSRGPSRTRYCADPRERRQPRGHVHLDEDGGGLDPGEGGGAHAREHAPSVGTRPHPLNVSAEIPRDVSFWSRRSRPGPSEFPRVLGLRPPACGPVGGRWAPRGSRAPPIARPILFWLNGQKPYVAGWLVSPHRLFWIEARTYDPRNNNSSD